MGQSKRNLKSCWAEHKPGVRPEIKSPVQDHAECSGHNVTMNNVSILEKNVHNLDKRAFFESLYLVLDNSSQAQ